MTKLLIGLSVVQLIVLGFLAMKVGDLQARVGSAEAEPSAPAAQSQIAAASPASTVAALGADDIRQIIREELANAPATADLPQRQAAAPSAAPPADRAPDPVVSRAVRADVQSYLARGRISRSEMAALQLKMATLPSAERTQILREMTKAMNDGRLAGEF